MKMKIQKLNDENKVVATYDNIMAAAKDIESKKDPWQVAITLAYAITHHRKAYKSKWRQIKINK